MVWQELVDIVAPMIRNIYQNEELRAPGDGRRARGDVHLPAVLPSLTVTIHSAVTTSDHATCGKADFPAIKTSNRGIGLLGA